jgi:hypothetical protein
MRRRRYTEPQEMRNEGISEQTLRKLRKWMSCIGGVSGDDIES